MVPHIPFNVIVKKGRGERVSVHGGVGGGVVNKGHIRGFVKGVFVVLDNGKECVDGIMGLCARFCSELVGCECLMQFSMCCESSEKNGD